MSNALASLDLRVPRQSEIELKCRTSWDTRTADYDLFEQFDGILPIQDLDLFSRIVDSYPTCKVIILTDHQEHTGGTSGALDRFQDLVAKKGLECLSVGTGDLDNAELLAGFLGLELAQVRARQSEEQNWAGDKLSFVVPVVHPKAAHLQEYGTVERVLRESVTSYCAQDGADTNLIVICHQVPDWADACSSGVTFINLGDHPVFYGGKLVVEVDKGLKHLIGTLFARQVQSASAIMFGDGDDFVRRDLARTVLPMLVGHPEGMVITVGYNAHLTPVAGKFELAGVLKVFDFFMTCGTDRVFRSDQLERCMLRWHPDLSNAQGVFEPGPHPNEIRVSDAFLNWLWDVAGPRCENKISLAFLLGGHEERNAVFDHYFCPEPLVAKGCGHGNHHGPRKGEVHWHRSLALKNRDEFLQEFGVDPTSFKIDGWHPLIWARILRNAMINRIKFR